MPLGANVNRFRQILDASIHLDMILSSDGDVDVSVQLLVDKAKLAAVGYALLCVSPALSACQKALTTPTLEDLLVFKIKLRWEYTRTSETESIDAMLERATSDEASSYDHP